MTVEALPTLLPTASLIPTPATVPAIGGDASSCDVAVDSRAAPALRDRRGDRQARTVILGAGVLGSAPAARAVLADHEATAGRCGVRCERVLPTDCAPWLPWLDLHEFAEALWFPDEAYTDSHLLGNAYGAAARELGVRFRTGVRARLFASGESVGIEFPDSRMRPDSVWVVAGAWSSRVLSSVGLCAPQAAVRSHYWVTAPTPLTRPEMPIVLAPDLRFYARRELGSILFGLREPNGVAAAGALLPDDLQGFVFEASDPEGQVTLEGFAPSLDRFASGLMRTGLKHYVAGPSCYTPDGEFLVGALSGWSNLRLLSGCNGAGVASSAGLADLAADIEAGADVASEPLLARFDPGRFGAVDAEAPDFQARCVATRAGKTSG